MPDGWIAPLAKCSSLELIDIINTKIELNDISEIGNLQVSSLCFNNNDLSPTARKKLVDVLCEMTSLKSLAITDESLTDDEVARLAESFSDASLTINGQRKGVKYR